MLVASGSPPARSAVRGTGSWRGTTAAGRGVRMRRSTSWPGRARRSRSSRSRPGAVASAGPWSGWTAGSGSGSERRRTGCSGANRRAAASRRDRGSAWTWSKSSFRPRPAVVFVSPAPRCASTGEPSEARSRFRARPPLSSPLAPARFRAGSHPKGGTNSVVECNLAKVEVAGSNPVSRSGRRTASAGSCGRRSQVAKAEVCKTSIRRFESARRLQLPEGSACTIRKRACRDGETADAGGLKPPAPSGVRVRVPLPAAIHGGPVRAGGRACRPERTMAVA